MSPLATHSFARCTFHAARHVKDLPEGHVTAGLHGHNFVATVMEPVDDSGPLGLELRLKQASAKLNFSDLNRHLENPTDTALASWLQKAMTRNGQPPSMGVRSTDDWISTVNEAGKVRICHAFEFDASHWLPGVPPEHQCARLHGHHFRVAITVDADAWPVSPMEVYDRIAEEWRPLEKLLRGNCLNDVEGLENPTSEFLSQWIWNRLQGHLPGLAFVKAFETRGAGCRFNGHTFNIWKDQRFESAIPNPAATTSTRVTGRGYVARLHLESGLDSKAGWVQDFGDVRDTFAPYLKQLDHHFLERFPVSEGDGCIALAQWLMEELPVALPKLQRIELFESPTAGVIISRPESSPRLAYPLA